MTVREGINLAYYHLVSDMREEDRLARMAGHRFDVSLDERIERFEEQIGLRPNHEELALWYHKNVLLPALGRKWEDEEVASDLPPGVGEADRWRFEDLEWDGLKDFEGNPWDLPGMSEIRQQRVAENREKAAEEARDTLGGV